MSKQQGVSSELLFRYECITKGITPSVPDLDYGCGFDVITSHGGNLLKIQIKSTDSKRGDGYRAMVARGSKNKQRYTKEHCDIIAVHIVALDIWYFIPIEDVKGINLSMYPKKLNHRYSKYINAWHLLAS
jgi:hypothetical protein